MTTFALGFAFGIVLMLAVNFFAPSFYRGKIELLQSELRKRG